MIPAIRFPLTAAASAIALWFGSASGVQAALVDTGHGLVNDTDRNITWVRDANLFLTQALASGDAAGFVATIIAAVPGGAIKDTPNRYDTPDPEHPFEFSGSHTLSADDFRPDTGRMSWFGALAWVEYLNSIRYGGYTGWRLPATAGDLGTGVDSELGHLFYSEFGGTTYESIVTTHANGANFDLFENIQGSVYWSGTEYVRGPYMGWAYFNGSGQQDYSDKNSTFYGWAVRNGQAAESVVPLPGAVWLMGSVLTGLAAWRRAGSTG